LVGAPVELRAVPFDVIGVELAGAVDYAWTSADPTLVAVETLSDLSRIRIRALREGETTLNVMAGGQSLSLVVHVSGEAPESDAGEDAGEDGGPDDEDAGDDAGVQEDGGQS
jgi:hypothetical protein